MHAHESTTPAAKLSSRPCRARARVRRQRACRGRTRANPGLKLKPVRNDDERGEFLGLVGFAPFVRSALAPAPRRGHQFRARRRAHRLPRVADAAPGRHQRASARRTTRSRTRTRCWSRAWKGPVWYPPRDGEPSGVHAGSRQREFVNPAPMCAPEINVSVDALPQASTPASAGVRRQTIFDYAGTGTSAPLGAVVRCARPPRLPRCRASDWIELWVRGGEIEIDGQRAFANCFVVVEPGADVRAGVALRRAAARLGRGPRAVARHGVNANLLGALAFRGSTSAASRPSIRRSRSLPMAWSCALTPPNSCASRARPAPPASRTTRCPAALNHNSVRRPSDVSGLAHDALPALQRQRSARLTLILSRPVRAPDVARRSARVAGQHRPSRASRSATAGARAPASRRTGAR